MLNAIKRHPLRMYIVLLVFFKLILAAHTPIYVIGSSGRDDMLQAWLASQLLKFQWLGTYNQDTLVKGITYPLFLAANFIIGTPINVATTLLYGMSCAFFVWVLSPYLGKNWIRAVVFSILFFCPINADIQSYMRIYRFSIIPSFVLLVFALMFGMYARRGKKSALLWSLGAGLALGLFWNIREDSIWIMPFVFMCCLLVIITLFIENRRAGKKMLCTGMLVAFIPLAVLFLLNTTIKAINFAHYGTFTRIEFSEGNFPRLIKAIYSVESDEDVEHVTVPNSTLEKLYKVSPSFAELEKYFSVNLNGNGWSTYCPESGGNLCDAHFMWCLRDLIETAGYGNSAAKMEEYCARAATEINAALDDGLLPRKEGAVLSTSLVSPWKERYWKQFPEAVANGFLMAASNVNDQIYPIESLGGPDGIRSIELLTHNFAIHPARIRCTLNGWIVSLDDKVLVNMAIFTKNQQSLVPLVREGSDDIYEQFLSNGQNLLNAKTSRFEARVELDEPEDIYLIVTANGLEIAREVLSEDTSSISGEGFVAFIENCTIETIADKGTMEANVSTSILNYINEIYHVCTLPLTLLGLICWILLTVGLLFEGIRRRGTLIWDTWLFSSAVLFSALILIGGVAYTHVAAYPALFPAYLAGAYPLILAFWQLSIIFTLRWLIGLRTNKKTSALITKRLPEQKESIHQDTRSNEGF